jgi:hypothetical protein
MKELEVLRRWRETETQDVPLGRLKIDRAFQPRDVRIVPFADRARAERETERHIARLADALSGGDLEPLLAARIDGALYVIDGHHRLKAHRRAGKRTTPARILETDAATAGMVSKLVNCDGAKLPMHAEQARECAWQWMAHDSAQGTRPLSLSDRQVARTFGTTKDTIGNMRRALPTVNPGDFTHEACDPGTGWPLWKYVKGNAMRDRFACVPEDERQRVQDERLAAKLAAMLDKSGRNAFLRAVALLKDEAVAEALAELADAVAEHDA